MPEGFKKHAFRYYHAGSWWHLGIWAQSEEDAKERINKLPLAQYVGTLEAVIPDRLGFVAKAVCWCGNSARRIRHFLSPHGDN